MNFRRQNSKIAGVIEEAKDYAEMNLPEIAAACGVAPSTLSNKKSKKELPTLSFWAVSAIAQLAGYRIDFVEEER